MNRAERIIKPEQRSQHFDEDWDYMGKTIEITASDGFKLGAYSAGPENATKGIVVIQEIFGVNKHVRDMADSYAAAGYKVLAPAMFDRSGQKGSDLGYGPDDRKAGMEMRGKITEEQNIMDVVAAAKALGTASTGIVGYCFGGSMAWFGATRTKEFQAASCWYGGGIAKAKDEKPNCPVQMHFGETDGSIPITDIEAIKAAQPGAEIYVYKDAGHGFGCADRDSFNKEAYETAQKRTLDFFAKNLK
jgi:carboxymethylenebutenolidase